LARVEGEDVAEAFDEVFLHSGAVALKKAERVGSFTAVDDSAPDVRLIADEQEGQAICRGETRAIRIRNCPNGDGLALTGEIGRAHV
jgi:hypothetical protein